LPVKINANRGARQEMSVSTKVSKQIAPFQPEFPTFECDIKNDPIRHSESDKKIRLHVVSWSFVRGALECCSWQTRGVVARKHLLCTHIHLIVALAGKLDHQGDCQKHIRNDLVTCWTVWQLNKSGRATDCEFQACPAKRSCVSKERRFLLSPVLFRKSYWQSGARNANLTLAEVIGL